MKRNGKPLVTMISKPVVPPWDDSAKNIVKYQVTNGERYSYRVLTDDSADPPAPGVLTEPIYPGAGKYSPGFKQNLKVMMYGLRPRGAAIYHYFFAPNPLSSKAGRVQKALARVKTIQTICSAPATYDGIDRLLFTDMVVVLSAETKRCLVEAGVNAGRVRLIRPGIEPVARGTDVQRMETRRSFGLPESGPVAIFPGDYEFSQAADTVAKAVPILKEALPDIKVVFACRIKREPSRVIRNRIRTELESSGFGSTAIFVDQVDNMPAFVGAADVVLLPSESLYAKMDVPLVLLEAMSQKVPLVLADVPPLDELIGQGAGVGVPPQNPEALAKATLKILSNDSLAAEIGQTGAKMMNEHYSAGAMAEAVEAVYDEVIEL